jgi:hypothetical protein
LEDVHDRRGRDRERAKTALAQSRKKRVRQADQFVPVLDEAEGAAGGLPLAMGGQLGEIESHLMAEVIAGILND